MESLSSPSAKEFAEDSSKPSSRRICLHRLRVFDPTDCGRKLRVLHLGSKSRGSLCMRHVRGHLENFFHEMIDAIEKSASARNKNAGAYVINERFLLEAAFEQIERLAQSQMNDRVQ